MSFFGNRFDEKKVFTWDPKFTSYIYYFTCMKVMIPDKN